MNIVENKKINRDSLLKFGFTLEKDIYTYKTLIMKNQFELTVKISATGDFKTSLTEVSTGELYTLHLAKYVSGEFVGRVKDEYNRILENIFDKCFDKDIFKQVQTKEIINYISEKYNDELEYLWEKFPDNAIVRRKDNKKWYVVILTINKQKLGFSEDEKIEIIDLRADDVEDIVDDKNIFRGYHMNKKYWITILLDNNLPTSYIIERIDKSYLLAKKK